MAVLVVIAEVPTKQLLHLLQLIFVTILQTIFFLYNFFILYLLISMFMYYVCIVPCVWNKY